MRRPRDASSRRLRKLGEKNRDAEADGYGEEHARSEVTRVP